jgi:competence protein ComEA
MASGLTRSEQIALVGVTALIVGGLAVRQWRGGAERTSLMVESDPRWERIEVDLDQLGEGRGSTRTLDGATTETRLAERVFPSANPDSPAAIDINTAGEVELDRLPGIGPVKAQAIVQYRNLHGPFADLEALLDVSGIGPSTLERLRPYAVALSGAETAQSDASSVAVAPRDVLTVAPEENVKTLADPEPSLLININTAGFEELQEIHGIGPVLAGRILDYRARRPFRRPEDLIEIKGIGPKSFEKMRPYVTVN